jgi:hypothetical protein
MTGYGLTAEAVETLQAVLEFITANPDKHNQGTWLEKRPEDGVALEKSEVAKCGTVGCLAGHLALFGSTIPDEAWKPVPEYRWEDGGYTGKVAFWDIDFDVFSPTHAAEEALGVSAARNPELREARYYLGSMFEGDRTINELWWMGQELTDGRLTIPDGIDPQDPYSYDEYYGDDHEDEDW